jgi:hypothetical protein
MRSGGVRSTVKPIGERTVVRPDAAVGETHFVVRQDRHGSSRNASPGTKQPADHEHYAIENYGRMRACLAGFPPGAEAVSGYVHPFGAPGDRKSLGMACVEFELGPPSVVKSRLLSGFAGRLAQR